MAHSENDKEQRAQAALEDTLEQILGVDEEAVPVLPPISEETGGAEADLAGMASLMDDVYSEGRRLRRMGDCVLMVSDDGLVAKLRGMLPGDMRYEGVVKCLEEEGICFGLKPNAIHAALPHKKKTRRASVRRPRRNESEDDGATSEFVIAEGQPPRAPGAARIEYAVHALPEEDMSTLRELFMGKELEALRRCRLTPSFVRAGEELARVIAEPGRVGRDVFGAEIAPPLPEMVALEAGENVELAADRRSCRAQIMGYVGWVGGALSVQSPLYVTRDLTRVFLIWLARDGAALSPAEINAALEDMGICFGIDSAAIAAIVAKGAAHEALPRAQLLARGSDAVMGQGAEWRYSFPAKQTRYFGEIMRIFNRSPHVRYLEEYCRGLAGKAVSAGGEIARKMPAKPGQMGRDIFGEEFLPEEPSEGSLEAGDHIHLDEDMQQCVAEIYGYVGIGAQRVEIVSPIWVDAERMVAYFINLAALGERAAPTPAEVEHLLELAEVKFGIDDRAMSAFCERVKQNMATDITVPIARGRKRRHGRNGRFAFAVGHQREPGVFREDGSLDFKQLNMIPLVKAEQHIGSCIPATEGSDGMEVSGRRLRCRNGVELIVDIGPNIRRLRAEGAPDTFVAEVEGELTIIDRSEKSPPSVFLAVHEKLVVQGDVDYHTGNIDFPGSVEVRGAIQAGFVVKAEGNVWVCGHVDEGGRIECGGNVAVQHGISGEATRIQAKGSVCAKYINAAHIQAGVDLSVGEYIHRAQIQVGADLTVIGQSGAKHSGSIVGGMVIAGGRIFARDIGSEAGGITRLVAGVDAKQLKEAAALQQLIDQCNTVIKKTLRVLEVEKVDECQMRNILLNLLLKARGPRRKIIALSVRGIVELQQRRKAANERKGVLDEQMRIAAARASIEMTGVIATKTVVKIGSHTMVMGAADGEVARMRYALGVVEGKEKIVAKAI